MAEARGAASSGAGATGWASSLGSRLDVARKGLGRGLAWAGGAAVISSLAVVAARFQAQRVCVFVYVCVSWAAGEQGAHPWA